MKSYLLFLNIRNDIIKFFLILILFSINLSAPLFANEQVNISSFSDDGFYLFNEVDEVIGGFAYDFQSSLNRYLNWDVSYTLSSWKECQENVFDGKTDLLFGVFKTDERQKNFSFNKIPIAVVSNYVCARADTDYLDDDYTKMAGKTVGLIDGSNSSKKFQDFLRNNNIDVDYVIGTSSDELRAKLIAHEIDYLILNTNISCDEKVVQKFSQDSMYIMANKDNKYLLDEIDTAIERMNEINPFLLKQFQSKMYTDKSKKLTNMLDGDEVKFIKTAEPLLCGVLDDVQPYYYKSTDNEDIGLIVSIINEISQESGLDIILVPFKNRESELVALRNGEIDMLSKMPNDYHLAQKYNLNLSIPYIKTQVSVIKNQLVNVDEGKNKVYAIPYQIIDHREEIKRNISDIELKYYSNPQSCIEAINNGDVNGSIIEDFNILQNKGEIHNTNELVSFALSGIYFSHCFAFSNQCDAHYIDIFDKAISTLDTTNINFSLIDQEQSVNSSHIIKTYFQRYILFVILIVLIILFCVAFFYYIFIKTEKENEELNLANKKAIMASKAKTEFLSNMSHELRTPLNAIIGLNTLLKDSLDDRNITEDYISKIDQSSKILLSTINDILDMSAIESGKIKLANQIFNIKESVYSVTNIYYQQCNDKGIDFKFTIGNIEFENLVGDSYRIRQVLLNLISNAFKFTENNGTIEVFLNEEKNDGKVILSLIVSDTGCGMDKELQKRLFNKFEQQDATTVRKYGGSGLGLSICQSLVDLMDGKISVESKKNVGTKFTVKVPLEIGKSADIIAENAFQELDVLIVDDDEETCKYISSILNKWNVSTEYCLSSILAIEKVKERILNKNEYSLYIIDIKIPSMNGFELSNKLEKIIKNDSKIIMISSYDIDEIKRISNDFELKRYIRKPIFQSELYYKIVGLLDINSVAKEEINEIPDTLEDVNVLLVEDNKMNQLIASRIIQKKGAKVDLCNNGQQAVDAIRNRINEYDVIFMDIQMPIMDGYEATKIIRSMDNEYAKNIEIYAMTANSFNKDVQKSKDYGMNGHISKPIDTKNLFSILNKIKQKK